MAKESVENQLNEKNYISLRQLAMEIYKNYNEDYAYKKILKNFKILCIKLGIDRNEFKSKRDYKIPLMEKTNWSLLLENMKIFDGKNSEDAENFLKKLYSKKSELNNILMDPNAPEINVEDLASIEELFYSNEDVKYIMHSELTKKIYKDFEYISSNAPKDRIVYYSEFYQNEVLRKADKTSGFIKKMIEEKWNEK